MPPIETSLAATATSTTLRVTQVLMAFVDAERPLGVSEIARSCTLSKAVVHRILQTLVESALVDYLPDLRQYTPGPRMIALGRAAARSNLLHKAAMPVISNLAHRTRETATLTERRGHGRHYIGLIESTNPIRITVRLNEDAPLWSGASGLSILAFMPPDDVDFVLREERIPYTRSTVTDEVTIRERLAEIRARGWAHTAGERVQHSSSIAAPIFDSQDTPVGSLSVAFLEDRLLDSEHVDLAKLVTTAAREASARLRAAEQTPGVRA
jgi:IclR family acetate operon transcriptional repressor